MPRDDGNGGRIELQDAVDALLAAFEEAARAPSGDTNCSAEPAPKVEREVDRMLCEWRAEADATRDWPTRSAAASRISPARSAGRRAKPCSPTSRALAEETEKADHDGSKRLDKREASPFQIGSPA
jgi:hypothetical protein